MAENSIFNYDWGTVEYLSTPIILVIGSGENIDKRNIQDSFLEYYRDNGYKVKHISSRIKSEDETSLPNYLFDESIPNIDKIIRFNHYLKSIETLEKIDLFIIGIPGAALPLKSRLHEGFGIVHFLLSNSFNPDFVVYVDYLDKYSDEYYSFLINTMKYRFSFTVDAIYCSDVRIDWLNTSDSEKSTMKLHNSNIVNEYTDCNNGFAKVPVYNKYRLKELVDYSQKCLVKYNEEAIF